MAVEILLLSESVDGRPIALTASAVPGTLIHKAPPGTTSIDRVYLYVANVSAVNMNAAITWGGNTNQQRILNAWFLGAGSAPLLVSNGFIAQDGLEVRGVSGSGPSSFLTVTGYVERITTG